MSLRVLCIHVRGAHLMGGFMMLSIARFLRLLGWQESNVAQKVQLLPNVKHIMSIKEISELELEIMIWWKSNLDFMNSKIIF